MGKDRPSLGKQHRTVAKKAAISVKLIHKTDDPELSKKNHIPLKANILDVGAGIGTTCYFVLLKDLGILFIFLSLCSLALSAMYGYFGHRMSGKTNFLIWFTPGSFISAYWNGEYNYTHSLLALIPECVFSLILFIGLRAINKHVRSVSNKVNDNYLSCGDYGLFVENIPKDFTNAKLLSEHFNELMGGQKVHSVLLPYDTKKLCSIQKQIETLTIRYHQTLHRHDTTTAGLTKFRLHNLHPSQRILNFKEFKPDEEVDDVDGLADGESPNFMRVRKGGCFQGLLRLIGYWQDGYDIRSMLKSLITKRSKLKLNQERLRSTGCAFIMFDYAMDARDTAVKYSRSTKIGLSGSIKKQRPECKLLGEHPLRVTLGVEPDDVNFENLHVSRTNQFCRRTCVNIISFIFIAIGVVIPLVVNLYKNEDNSTFLSFMISISLTALSTAIAFILMYLTPFTKPRTQTIAVSSTILRIWLGDFLMGIGVTFIISIINSRPSCFIDTQQSTCTRYFLSYEWFREVAFDMLTTVGIDAIKVLFLQITQIVNFVFRLPYTLFAGKYPQNEVTRGYEPEIFPLEYRMAHLIKIIFICMLASPFMPIVIPLLCVYLLIIYWVDKYNLLRRFRAPLQLSFEAVQECLETVCASFHLHALAVLILYGFMWVINRKSYDREFKLFLPLLIYGAPYAIVLLWRLLRSCGKARKEGFVNKLTRVEENKEELDETMGMDFGTVENLIVNYIDMHPMFFGAAKPLMNESEEENVVEESEYQKMTGQMVVKTRINTLPPKSLLFFHYFKQDGTPHILTHNKKMACIHADQLSSIFASLLDPTSSNTNADDSNATPSPTKVAKRPELERLNAEYKRREAEGRLPTLQSARNSNRNNLLYGSYISSMLGAQFQIVDGRAFVEFPAQRGGIAAQPGEAFPQVARPVPQVPQVQQIVLRGNSFLVYPVEATVVPIQQVQPRQPIPLLPIHQPSYSAAPPSRYPQPQPQVQNVNYHFGYQSAPVQPHSNPYAVYPV
ncbi:hypothetical protein BLNAU_16664 [Blattamonas nauphoetae]|uniref:CSC1/OSCA1-like cytosolic domain-containing protein n=1 Tax=Blattamonas nauphoetae TaxID=2049346 RepID=A0ABQ9X9N0_9EUKA|nr:hypothetical protein BLNAU_16664 [Blattamonas nauphoetae]